MTVAAWELSKNDRMRAQVLDHLRAQPDYVSGEELSQKLGATRNTVWKCIQSLRNDGYTIEGTTNKGYRLLVCPDTPFAWEVRAGLRTSALGQTTVYLPVTESTNDVARQMARAGAPSGLLVVSDAQTKGRGRRGRSWVSPPQKGLWMSLIVRPSVQPAKVALFPLLTGAAVAAAISKETDLPALLKWPNDVWVRGKKVCGILLEMSAEAEVIHYLVLGMGINVNIDVDDLPSELRMTASSLKIELGQPVARVALLQRILVELEQRYSQLLSGGEEAILAEVRNVSATLGRSVDVWGHHGVICSGVATAIEADGGLRVRDNTGRESVYHAGDVSIRRSV